MNEVCKVDIPIIVAIQPKLLPDQLSEFGREEPRQQEDGDRDHRVECHSPDNERQESNADQDDGRTNEDSEQSVDQHGVL
eukprot:CAMPEP_0177690056 /NCGR_PEP_ID=MMETSP0484_2-20121128/544_1 /TAXON_ID=354590 /ORGANISM="Rhodomonas lens, Strain RHODO" /LENGTH=79 /DNA_ID=CAMNT_0019200537 /DNA_START=154 /DNA_END=393 /DNA_ORIENTATION=-